MTDEQMQVITRLTYKMVALGLSVKAVPEVTVGPIVSVYRFLPLNSTRVAHIEALSDDFAVELGVEDVVVKRMPGDNCVAIFVPNKTRKPINFLQTTTALWQAKDEQAIPLNLGVTQVGEPLIEDLATQPHLLIAGATGAGKSTLLVTIITSIAASKKPTEVQFVLSDTKGVEFRAFEGLPHLLYPITFEAEDTIKHLEKLIYEMEDRLDKIGSSRLHNISEWNAAKTHKLPYVVLVIDELADILEVRGEKRGEKPGQEAIGKLAQKARASGIHIVAATQRPSVDIVRGSIKVNFPARATFRLSSEADSRTIIGTSGAEHLLAQGDMFYVSPNRPGIIRAHAPLTREIDIQSTLDALTRRMYK